MGCYSSSLKSDSIESFKTIPPSLETVSDEQLNIPPPSKVTVSDKQLKVMVLPVVLHRHIGDFKVVPSKIEGPQRILEEVFNIFVHDGSCFTSIATIYTTREIRTLNSNINVIFNDIYLKKINAIGSVKLMCEKVFEFMGKYLMYFHQIPELDIFISTTEFDKNYLKIHFDSVEDINCYIIAIWVYRHCTGFLVVQQSSIRTRYITYFCDVSRHSRWGTSMNMVPLQQIIAHFAKVCEVSEDTVRMNFGIN